VTAAFVLKTDMEQRLASLVFSHGRTMFRIAFDILRDAAAAEDACQQAFLKAWERQDSLRSPEALRAWVAQTVVNESLGMYRRRRTENRVLHLHARETTIEAHDNPGAGEQREKVLASVAELPEPVRTVVVLRFLDGMSGNQVKDLLQTSAVDVSRQLHHGMELLRQKLKPWHTTAGEP
jgi:RNA polymerase sigma-70 factor (ECF subfamily)